MFLKLKKHKYTLDNYREKRLQILYIPESQSSLKTYKVQLLASNPTVYKHQDKNLQISFSKI